MVAHAFNPVLALGRRRQRQADLCEFEPSLQSSRTARAIQRNPVLKKQKGKEKGKERGKERWEKGKDGKGKGKKNTIVNRKRADNIMSCELCAKFLFLICIVETGLLSLG